MFSVHISSKLFGVWLEVEEGSFSLSEGEEESSVSIDESVVSVEDAEGTGVSTVESSVLFEDTGKAGVSTVESSVLLEDTGKAGVSTVESSVLLEDDGETDTVVSADVMDDELTASKELLGKDDDELTLLPEPSSLSQEQNRPKSKSMDANAINRRLIIV